MPDNVVFIFQHSVKHFHQSQASRKYSGTLQINFTLNFKTPEYLPGYTKKTNLEWLQKQIGIVWVFIKSFLHMMKFQLLHLFRFLCELCFNFSHTCHLFHTDSNSFYSIHPIKEPHYPTFPPKNSFKGFVSGQIHIFPKMWQNFMFLCTASVMKVSASLIHVIVLSEYIL